jgi:hypothetical protein
VIPADTPPGSRQRVWPFRKSSTRTAPLEVFRNARS